MLVLLALCGLTPAVAQSDTTATVFTIVDERPQVVQSEDGSSNVLAYPDSAREAGIEGTVYLQIVVEPDGRPTNVTVLKGVHALLDKEARRFAQTMNFTPGRKNGEIVRTRMTIPIRFKLEEEKVAANPTETTSADDLPRGPVDQPPRIIGGLRSLQKVVNYPEEAVEMKIQGRVFVRCIVSEKGEPTDITVIEPVHPLLDEEAVRAMRKLRFEPAMMDGKPVAISMTLPVTFRLN